MTLHRPVSEHLFGMAAFGTAHVAPYCTCGLIFAARNVYERGPSIRREWVAHIKKIMDGSEIKDPLA